MPEAHPERTLEGLHHWSDELVCPICFAALQISEAGVLCGGCGRQYPVEDGIPVLIAQRAILPPNRK